MIDTGPRLTFHEPGTRKRMKSYPSTIPVPRMRPAQRANDPEHNTTPGHTQRVSRGDIVSRPTPHRRITHPRDRPSLASNGSCSIVGASHGPEPACSVRSSHISAMCTASSLARPFRRVRLDRVDDDHVAPHVVHNDCRGRGNPRPRPAPCHVLARSTSVLRRAGGGSPCQVDHAVRRNRYQTTQCALSARA